MQNEYSKVVKINTKSSKDCPFGICDGKGSIFYDLQVEDYGSVEYCIDCKCKGVQAADTEFRKARSMMPFEYIDKKSKDFKWDLYGKSDIKTIKATCDSFIMDFVSWESKGKGLYLYSKTMGSGKTLLACILANEIADRYTGSIRFTTVSDYLSHISDEMKAERGEHKESESIKNARLLIIDDIGNTPKKEWTDTKLYDLINYRLTSRKVTIFTSNVAPQALKIDPRVNERIEKMAIPIALPEVSIRMMKANEENEDFLRQILSAPAAGDGVI